MRIVYFISPKFRYETVIYSGVGPRFAQSFGWPIEPISSILDVTCDVGLIDGRLTEEDFGQIDAFLAGSSKKTFPIFFRLSDPEMPTYEGEEDKYVFRKKDLPGVHYFSIYDPEGPLLDFVRSLKHSRVVRLPYPYDASKQIERDFALRRRRVFLSGRNPAALSSSLRLATEKAMESAGTACRIRIAAPGLSGQREPPKTRLRPRALYRSCGRIHAFLSLPFALSGGVDEIRRMRVCGLCSDRRTAELAGGPCPPLLPALFRRNNGMLRAISSGRGEMTEMAAEYRRIMRDSRSIEAQRCIEGADSRDSLAFKLLPHSIR